MSLSPVFQAAVKQNGKVWTGVNHAEIILRMHRHGHPRIMSNQQGFVTKAGEFLSRTEAFERAVACGQLVGKLSTGQSLTSEDLSMGASSNS